ncbi:alanine--glyoxylate aminotransferase family protein [Candidatus Woesearchaeota archaeon]|nr:alanine--glyoxylate aminotransferase family protein [Candidatus Woesearchaeota archaeon]
MTLFIPGPTEVRKDVLAAMAKPQIGHRTVEFRELFSSLKPGLRKLLYTELDVLISTSSGSGFWEASIRSCVQRHALHATNGAFSKKWASVAERCGKKVTRIEYPFGKAVKAKDVEEYLQKGQYDAFCMVHNETSTGVASNLEEIAEVMKKHPDVLWMVDAVSSIAGTKIEVDKLGIDICFASSQKALALPAGIAISSVSDKAYAKAANVEGRGYYFDLLELKKSYDKDMTPYTPSIPHLYALQYQLGMFAKEGLEERFTRQRKNADYVRQWAKEQGFTLFSEEGYHSDTIVCLSNTKDVDFSRIKKDLAAKGITMDAGYGKLNEALAAEGKPTTFRIATMGDLTLAELEDFTQQLENYW